MAFLIPITYRAVSTLPLVAFPASRSGVGRAARPRASGSATLPSSGKKSQTGATPAAPTVQSALPRSVRGCLRCHAGFRQRPRSSCWATWRTLRVSWRSKGFVRVVRRAGPSSLSCCGAPLGAGCSTRRHSGGWNPPSLRARSLVPTGRCRRVRQMDWSWRLSPHYSSPAWCRIRSTAPTFKRRSRQQGPCVTTRSYHSIKASSLIPYVSLTISRW